MWKEILLLVACYGGTVLSIRIFIGSVDDKSPEKGFSGLLTSPMASILVECDSQIQNHGFVASLIPISSMTECTHDSECGVGECCYYHEGPMLASKKRQVFNNFPVMFQGGWCERYLSLNERCDSIDKMNGHCGCGPGLTCTLIHDVIPTVQYLTPSRKRDTIFGAQEESKKRGAIFGGHEECRPTT